MDDMHDSLSLRFSFLPILNTVLLSFLFLHFVTYDLLILT